MNIFKEDYWASTRNGTSINKWPGINTRAKMMFIAAIVPDKPNTFMFGYLFWMAPWMWRSLVRHELTHRQQVLDGRLKTEVTFIDALMGQMTVIWEGTNYRRPLAPRTLKDFEEYYNSPWEVEAQIAQFGCPEKARRWREKQVIFIMKVKEVVKWIKKKKRKVR